MKVYTKTGDDGTTSLFSGKRVPKHDVRIKAYGTIDELNSWVGLIRDQANEALKPELIRIQNNLMTIGSQLANDANLPIPKINEEQVELLEKVLIELQQNFLH